ncbi:MAG: branched-chain amino acid ABC transporter permease [Candidatus Eisenbacteria bacterium]|uniref:Branched-chain amino acid ABC transporter permease n=1 Tax=Eiseniibacteriota bacterium TaxID=2212470 RepID=A0A9D6LA77_UNCEI|nr:branched-chain amino acid ABC transporter permease [Candidatus Eisenbacteria bacterium]MBI3539747.1 branched-chain amino acid ABC transporter permease [Candidatus Eisenbacteria bacterium]
MKQLLWCAGLLAVLLAVDTALPRIVNPYIAQVIVLCGINIILAVSLNLVNGFTGQFSIGHAGFMAIGAYSSAMFSLKVGAPWASELVAVGMAPFVAHGVALLAALILGGALAAIAGFLVGLPSLRLRGDYLAIVTLGFGEIIRVLILNVDAVGGARGLPGIPGWASIFWVGAGVAAVILLARHLALSTHGRALFAIRDDEVAAESLGVDTTRYKVLAFVIGAFFAGIAGGLFAHFLSYLNPNSFTFLKSIEVVAMVVLGGMGSISGSVLAAIVLTLLPEVLRPVREYRMVIYSLMLIVLMITRPGGLMGSREISLGWLRRRVKPARESV